MDGGGVTRKRGYLWVAAALLAALLVVVFVGLRSGGNAQPEGVAGAVVVDSLEELSRLVEKESSATRHRLVDGRPKGAHPTVDPRNRRAEAVGLAEPTSPPEHIYRKPRRITLELNSADSLDLVQLYNIGPSFANRILKYRSLLGGFVCKEQLWEVYGMDSARYNDIVPYLTVSPASVTPLDINSATIDQLKRHPYLDYYQAKAIVRMREHAGLYNGVEDLRKVPIIDNETYTKIKPYLTCNLQQNK